MTQAVEQKQTVVPEQDIVASYAGEFRNRLLAMINDGAMQIEVDLSKVRMVDSLGLGVFIAAHNSVHGKGGSLTVTGVSGDILKLFTTMRLDKHFTVKAAQ